MISDFSVFPSENKECRFGTYMYHEDTQSYFDDLDHYNMIKAMCRLSCSVCDKMEDNSRNKSKRKASFRDINQLKGHLFHQHKLMMCSLCLEGRKLYSKAQLEQHIHTGDSEVDGTESERGGFQGHPLCEFCRTPFYGDNELYRHMNTEHFKCHICERNSSCAIDKLNKTFYVLDDADVILIHFRKEHLLCEDEACLTKKFIVFQTEAEMKVHNAQEHGGRMSRSKHNAVLQHVEYHPLPFLLPTVAEMLCDWYIASAKFLDAQRAQSLVADAMQNHPHVVDVTQNYPHNPAGDMHKVNDGHFGSDQSGYDMDTGDCHMKKRKLAAPGPSGTFVVNEDDDSQSTLKSIIKELLEENNKKLFQIFMEAQKSVSSNSSKQKEDVREAPKEYMGDEFLNLGNRYRPETNHLEQTDDKLDDKLDDTDKAQFIGFTSNGNGIKRDYMSY
ncbi:hypothetical protein M8C21_010254 [Ambrosia artemisiifolia]|uniref:C2H2-type domain-containing protein n=1 Tax=Ambrosia artemisiifolia TaxID=4212 RepID=A0AAD5G6J8_AMBAR|nr:hypothetical protein M8C21_010254 [Ambrosia artemisiifolia]